MKLLFKSFLLIFSLLLFINSCSKDSPVPDAVVPTVTFTLAVTSSEGGSVNDPGDTHNENTNVSLTASPAVGYTFSEWTGDASGSTNPLSVSMTQNKNITANFIRTKYLLNIGKIGEGDVTQDIISTAKTSDEYNSGTLVRLSAAPSENWLFYAWNDGSTGFIDAATGLAEAEELNFTNPRDISIDRSLNVTATFEQIITEEDNPTNSVGKWKIKKPTSANKTAKAKANKTALAECGLSEIIFRTDGSFTTVTSIATFSGQYNFDGNTTIILTQAQEPFGTITNLLISNGSISFSISLVDGCNNDLEGNRDETYVESEDPITSANCKISSSLDSGSESQTIAQTNSIQDIVYSFSTTCTGSLSASADNLPPGVTMNFSNNQAILSGAPSIIASGTYDYTIVVTAPDIATSVNGQITVVAGTTTSSDTSNTIYTTKLTPFTNPDTGFGIFTKKVVVFDVPLYGTNQVDDAKLRHAANVMAQYLDNDEDGTPDNPLVVEALKSNNSFMLVWKNESDLNIFDSLANADAGQDLGADETIPEWHTNGQTGQFDATLEEVLHLITHIGYHNAYPNVFGEVIGSEIANAMDTARGGQFTNIPSSYPTGAWYTYDDDSCDYACQVTEYVFWTLTSILGAHNSRLDEIDEEWLLNTNAKVQQTDTQAYQLFTDTRYAFPTVLPDGQYQQ